MDLFLSILKLFAVPITTVLLTLIVTYLANSITYAIKKQRLNVAVYQLLMNIILNEHRRLTVFLKNSKENSIYIPTAGAIYSASIFEFLQICELDQEAQLYILDTLDRYNLMRKEFHDINNEQAMGLINTLKNDYNKIELRFNIVNKKSWFYYWKLEFMNLLRLSKLPSNITIK